MKKLFVLLLLIIAPINLDASELDRVYVDAEVEIAGGVKVKVLIKPSSNEGQLTYKVYLGNEELKTFDKTEESFKSSAIYNATSVEMYKVGILKNSKDYVKFYGKEFDEVNIENFEDYQKENVGNYEVIRLYDVNKESIYYLEFVITNILVEHNDVAEFYYSYFKDLGYDVKDIKIFTRLPFSSEIFEVWAHGDKNWQVTKDIEMDAVLLEKKNFKSNDEINLRMIFDREIFAININEDKKSGADATEIIKELENKRESNTNTQNLLFHVLIVLSALIVVSLIGFLIFKILKKRKNNVS